MSWYENCYRRHLLDMHIDDWSDEFLSEFSPEEYVRLLKKANVQVAMIYLQSHLGLCYWPSKTGTKRYKKQSTMVLIQNHRTFMRKSNQT